jgi:transcriptional regulator GlxA family with amidase domain
MRNVGILLFNDVEVLDFSGPYEVFSGAGRDSGPIPFYVFTIAEKPGPVFAFNGLSINPAYTISDCPPVQLLVIPGGKGTRKEIDNPVLLEWIKTCASRAELTMSVCTGSLLLGKAGLLDGLSATTHHGSLDLLRKTAPAAKVLNNKRFIDNGSIIVSAGISAGIDMSLHVVSRLLGKEVAAATAKYMEYDWNQRQ